MKRLGLFIILAFLADHVRLEAAEPDALLQKTASFAMGGVGAAASMSEGERALREVLTQADAVARLERILPEASHAGQLYALLGLRARDRASYKRALAAYGERHANVQTIRGCILMKEPFQKLVKEIDQGNYDVALNREWPQPVH